MKEIIVKCLVIVAFLATVIFIVAPPVEQPKVEEEPPAKLLDDLFRKTKATPCIYWLPLTEEQVRPRRL